MEASLMTMQILKAFKPHSGDATNVVAAYEPQEVIDLLNLQNRSLTDTPDSLFCSQIGVSLETVVECSDVELDAPNTDSWNTPVESIRELLAQAKEPQFLRCWP
jgi:hypothetical protein